MPLYRIGKAVVDLEVIGAGYQGEVPLSTEHLPWEMPSKERRDLEAFGKAGWNFQLSTDLDWGGIHAFNEGGPLAPGLLALHPSGGLVVLRNRVVLQFRSSVGVERIAYRLQSYSKIRALKFGENLFEVGLSLPDQDLEGHIHRELSFLLEDPEVVFAEPSILYHLETLLKTPVDTLDGPSDKWHWEQIELLAAWEAGGEWSKGKGKRVAIIDEGFHVDDPQIKPNVCWKLTLDPDGRVVTDKPMPEHYHGTLCAGLIGAVLDESEVNGAAPSCTLGLMALDAFCVCSQVALGIALQICADLPCSTEGVPKGQGADVISCSLGITGGNWELSEPLRMAMDCVLKEGRGGKGTPIVWATFDTDATIEPWAIEGYEPLIVASRSDYKDARIESGWGKGLDLLAPGHAVPCILWDGKDRLIKKESGSSLAAPCVAGVAALVLAVNPNLTREQVAEVVARSCDPVGGKSIPNEEVGWGRLNAKRAVDLALLMLKENSATDGCSSL